MILKYSLLSAVSLESVFFSSGQHFAVFQGACKAPPREHSSAKHSTARTQPYKQFWYVYVFSIRIIIWFYYLLSVQFTETEFKNKSNWPWLKSHTKCLSTDNKISPQSGHGASLRKPQSYSLFVHRNAFCDCEKQMPSRLQFRVETACN